MVTEILSGLWIGNINDAFVEEFYSDNIITIVINCTIDQGFLDLPNVKKVRVPLTDRLDPIRDMGLLKNNINKILDFIHDKIDEENAPLMILPKSHLGKTLNHHHNGIFSGSVDLKKERID